MNWISLLIQSGQYGNQKERKPRGATREEISYFQSLCGTPLTEEYKEFLEVCGKDDAGLFAHYDASFNIKELISLYESIKDFPDEKPPEGWYYINHHYLGNRLMMNSANGNIYFGYDGDLGGYYMENFSKLVYQASFRSIQSSKLKEAYMLAIPSIKVDLVKGNETIASSICSVMKKNLLGVLSFSDLFQIYAKNDEVVFISDVSIDGGVYCEAFSNNEKAFDLLVEVKEKLSNFDYTPAALKDK